MTDPADREDEKGSGDGGSVTATSTALNPPLCKQPPVTDPATRLRGGFEIHKMVHVPPGKRTEKKSAARRKCRVCSAHE
jgi:hypothetical protein